MAYSVGYAAKSLPAPAALTTQASIAAPDGS
jgi:hypothetical protein